MLDRSPKTRRILRCARVGSPLISVVSGTVVGACDRCAHDIHVTPASIEKIKQEASLYVVICAECVCDPHLPEFLVERGAN